ncbi:MAG TPA: glycoside hydrolase family 2 TIM barrel-domain containing protein [Terriglobia bacterium]|nr:glycoside hydrolase family 2 TIM barrel-domain containing protein [Terriglobia bacterium]
MQLEVSMETSKKPVNHSLISRRRFIQGTLAAGAVMGAVANSEADAGGRQNLSLDGMWKLYFDRQGRWAKHGWIADFLADTPRQVQIPWDEMRAAMEANAIDFPVPATWEEYRPDTLGEGWYWREVALPESEFPRAVRLRFNAVRYGAEVFWDGKRVALYLGGFTPFTMDLTSLAKPGTRHQLAVHVVNPGGGFAGNWQTLFFENIQIPQSHNFGGIWQPVELLMTSRVFIEDIFVEPRVSQKAALAHLTVSNHTSQEQTVTLDARAVLRRSSHAGKTRMTAVTIPAQQKLTVPMLVALDPLVLWEPSNPARYRLDVSLRGSSPALEDAHATMFGMRQFTVEGRFFYLNGRKFMVKSTINHQYYPVTVGYPPTPEFARKEVEVALQSGLNMMHIHRQIGHPELIEWADELGLLLYEEPGGVIFDESQHLDYPGIKLLLRQLSDLIVRDRNHAAIVAWGMSNENILDPSVITHMMQRTRALDPTRVVCDNSGRGLHMLHPYQKKPSPWRDLHDYPPAPIEAATYESMNQFGRPPDYAFRREDRVEALPRMPEEGPQIIGEFGYGGLPDFPASVKEFEATGKPSVEGAIWHRSLENLEAGFKKYDLEPVFGSVSEFCRHTDEIHADAQAEMLQALRTNPYNSGYAVSCFHDLAIWYCGITNIFRDPKPVSRRLAKVNAPLFPALEAEPSPARTGQEITIRCVLVNEDVLKGPATLSVTVTGPAGEKVLADTKHLTLAPEKGYVAPVFEKSLILGGASGHYLIRAEVEGSNGKRAVNERRLLALNPRDNHWPTSSVLLYDPDHNILPFFAHRNVSYELWSPQAEANGRPILVSDIQKWNYAEHWEERLRDLRAILAACRAGSTVGFLMESGDGGIINLLKELKVLSGPLRVVGSTGSFRGDFHYVKPHPIFAGLPVNTCMGCDYRNVIARVSMDGFEGDTIAGCNENAYWWGTDVGVISMGSGAAVISTLRLSSSLLTDAVAERILANLCSWKPR